MSYSDYRHEYDTVIIGRKDYQLVRACPTTVFNPKSHGITPYACADYVDAMPFDFVCTYRINKNTLHLEWLGIRSNDGRYPQINGISANDGTRATGKKSDKYFIATHLESRVYAFRVFKIGFTGKIWLGRKSAKDYSGWCMTGLRNEVAYEEVLELTLDHGVVTDTRDLSKKVARLRGVHEHVARLKEAGLLTDEERDTIEKQVTSIGRRESAVIACEAGLLAIERETYRPRHFVALLEKHYLASLDTNQYNVKPNPPSALLIRLLSMNEFTEMRLPRRLRDLLSGLFRTKSKEKEVLAYFLHALISSPAGAGIDKRLRAVVNRLAQESGLAETKRETVETTMNDITAERWPRW